MQLYNLHFVLFSTAVLAVQTLPLKWSVWVSQKTIVCFTRHLLLIYGDDPLATVRLPQRGL